MNIKLVFSVIVLSAMLLPDMARANTIGRGFSPVDFRALTQTYFSMYKSGNPTSDMLDEYAEMASCELYRKLFTNDFEWEKVRQSIRNDQAKYADNFHTTYEIAGDAPLERYDFERKGFPLAGRGKHENIGKLYIYATSGNFHFCGRSKGPKTLPVNYMVSLFNPLTVDLIKLEPEKARQIVDYFYQDKDQNKRVFMRYRVKLYDLNGVEREDLGLTAEFQGEILSIEYFIDPEMTRKFYTINFQSISEE